MTREQERGEWAAADDLLRRWLVRAREGQHSHHEAGKFFRRANYWLAVPIIVITTSLGTAAFASISTAVAGIGKVSFGVLSMLAAVLAGLQTHFRYAEKAEQHKNLGAQYGGIRRRIEAILALPYDQRGRQSIVLEEISYKLDAISGDGDVVSRRIFERTQRRLTAKDSATASTIRSGARSWAQPEIQPRPAVRPTGGDAPSTTR